MSCFGSVAIEHLLICSTRSSCCSQARATTIRLNRQLSVVKLNCTAAVEGKAAAEARAHELATQLQDALEDLQTVDEALEYYMSSSATAGKGVVSSKLSAKQRRAKHRALAAEAAGVVDDACSPWTQRFAK